MTISRTLIDDQSHLRTDVPRASWDDRRPVVPAFYPRFTEDDVRAALADTPAAVIVGPRQAGKTTLVKQVGAGIEYLTFDDPNLLDAARAPIRSDSCDASIARS